MTDQKNRTRGKRDGRTDTNTGGQTRADKQGRTNADGRLVRPGIVPGPWRRPSPRVVIDDRDRSFLLPPNTSIIGI